MFDAGTAATSPQYIVALSLLACAAGAAAWLDIKHRRIPNELSIVAAAAGLLVAAWADSAALGSHALHLLIALVGGMILFRLRVFGGGDAKFYAAMAAWFGLADAVLLLVAVSLCGLVLLFGWFGYRQLAGLQVRGKGGSGLDSLPYGVAIGAGAIVTMLL
jgi:prepilin peptidase CpaA